MCAAVPSDQCMSPTTAWGLMSSMASRSLSTERAHSRRHQPRPHRPKRRASFMVVSRWTVYTGRTSNPAARGMCMYGPSPQKTMRWPKSRASTRATSNVRVTWARKPPCKKIAIVFGLDMGMLPIVQGASTSAEELIIIEQSSTGKRQKISHGENRQEPLAPLASRPPARHLGLMLVALAALALVGQEVTALLVWFNHRHTPPLG